ncbi:superinfection immunity protein [Burkholderia ambifaria]|uniref:superinfection immunity protein n=1 Tax=Burkholderia ambifaria TaxID=152480 RepID=UPI001BA0D841|nr:superinfection immunity protein [Burkholderia ambifaria]MBR8256669.1 superinfection immunity protein [Burkholderia ambifaria]
MNMDALNGIVSGLATIAVAFAIYFAPSIVAYKADHRDYRAILTTNILVGWTGIGWVCALIWAQKH